VIYLGGGSALLPLPIDALSLEEKYHIIKLLQSKGANIQELNTVRQSMSQLKNGGLARIAKATTVCTSFFKFYISSICMFSWKRLLH
jgi:glycerate 2-kinase